MLRKKLRRDLFLHKGLFFAVTVIVFLGIAIYAASYDSYQNLKNSYNETHNVLNFADYNFNGGPFTKGDENTVEAISEVDSAKVRLVSEQAAKVPSGSKVAGRFIGVPSRSQPTINKLKIVEGEYLDSPSDQLMVEKHFYEDHKLTVGDKISVLGADGWEDFSIAASVISAEYIWPARSRQDILPSSDNFGVFFISEEKLQELIGKSVYNQVLAKFDPGTNHEELSEVVVASLGPERVVDAFSKERVPSNEALKQDLDGFRELSYFFPILFLAVASMSIYISLSRLIHTQRPQIGVLRANGYSTLSILAHYLSYGAIIATVGSIFGVILGIILARWMTIMYTDFLSIPVVNVSFYPLTVLIGVALAYVFSLGAALFPAKAAISVSPAEAMRGETPVGGRKSILESVIPFIRNLSPASKLPVRNITRNKRRSFSTIIGVIFSFVLIMVAWGMLDTIEILLDKQFNVVNKNDFIVSFQKPVSLQELSQIEKTEGVKDVEPVFVSRANIDFSGKKYSTNFFAVDSNTNMHTFFDENNVEINPPRSGLYVGRALEKELGVKVGDAVEVSFPQTGISFETKLNSFLNEPLGTVAYGNLEEVADKTGVETSGPTSVFVTIDSDDRKGIKNALSEIEFVALVEDTKGLLATIDKFLVLFYGIVGVMLTFGALMAAALMFNTMAVNITERTREIATMLTMGYSNKKIIFLIIVENIMLVTIALIPGLVAGYFASKYFMEQYNTDLFTLDFHFKVVSYLLIVVSIYVIGLISQIPSLLTIRKFKLSEIIRERIS
jgi:putative ABC transport system permease protein